MKINILIIVANELAENIHKCVYRLVEKENILQYVSHKDEVYWKDDSMLKICFELGVKNAISETAWIKLFDEYLKHNDVNRDATFLEICHYSKPDNRNDPFVIAYIPVVLVKE